MAAFLCAYTLIATEKIHRVAAALGGAGIDWNVIFLLLGMMITVEC
ncbi:hypothetical protein [Spongiactinospora rosea]|nr:hypothetical protein [Spongiactinospora rosea]